MSAFGNLLQHAVDRLEVDRGVLADRGVRAAAGLHAHDALGLQRAGHGEQALVFLGVDVVGDDDEVVALAHRLAQHLDQRGLARADRAADAHAQRRQLLGARGDVVQRAHGADDRRRVRRAAQERNSREYCVSCCADRIASIGVKAWRSLSASCARLVDRGRNRLDQRGEDALPGALAERHRLQRRLHHVLGPAEGEGAAAPRAAARRSARRRARRPPARSAPVPARRARPRVRRRTPRFFSHSTSERPICSVCARSSRDLARGRAPSR